MPVRILREDDVSGLVGMAEALEAVEEALREQGRGTGVNEPRRRVRQPHGTLHVMGGALAARGYWGLKAYTTTRQGARFAVLLYDGESGRLLALIEADRLGQLRTGAASGVATRYLAWSNACVMALLGTGTQAETQVEAVAAVRALRQVRVYSRTAEGRASFARRMAERLSPEVLPVTSVEEAVEGADVVTTITTAAEPILAGNHVAPGMHINAAGSNSAIRSELDAEVVRRATRIFVDDVAQARLESGDLIRAYERNALNWGRVRPLADVVAGVVPGRTSLEDVTLFESHGMALWDIALAAEVYERAEEGGVGELISFLD
jgi:ornithine cyclodeaminase/alanine dehydrogenase-like protein (mu-crystallin family)